MRVHRTAISHANGRVRLSAVIEFERRPEMSGTLWFELSEESAGYLTDRSDAFAIAALVPAMVFGEDITVEGPLSPRLLVGLRKYQSEFHRLWPDSCRAIEIDGYELSESKRAAPFAPETISAFSGGIDSFYSLMVRCGLAATPTSELPLTHLMFAHGFDISLANQRTYDESAAAYEQLARRYGVKLLRVATNFRDLPLGRAVDWETSFVSLLAAVAHLLAPRFARLVIPSSDAFDPRHPLKSNPKTDPLLSSESMEIVHDVPVSRVAKTRVVAMDSRAYDMLRVCWEKPDGLRNCGHCEKCRRTMLALDLLGQRKRFTTFPLLASTEQGVASWRFRSEDFIAYAVDLRDLAESVGRVEVVRQLDRAIARGRRAAAVSAAVIRIFGLSGRWAIALRRLVFRFLP